MKIEVLYPEVCNLYGDLMNIEYLRRSCSEIEVIKTSLKEPPLFASETPALIYMGSMSEQAQELVIEALTPYKARIKELIEGGTAFLITGNALEIFIRSIEEENGNSIPCLGLFEFTAKRRMMNRYNSLYLGKLDDMDIVGFKSQFTHAYGSNENSYLFETVRGDGLNPQTKWEGIRKNNFMSTYVIGPLTVLNPPFAKYLLRLVGVEEPVLAFEKAAYDVYQLRLAEFQNPNTGFKY